MTRSSKNQSGMGLVEVIVAAGVMVIVTAGILKLMTNMNKNQRMLTAVAVRNGKVNVTNAVLEANAPRILGLAVNPKAKTPLCSALADCVNNPASCPVPEGSCAFYDFGNMQITGSESAPMRIDLEGKPCKSKSAQCPLEVIGKFRLSPSASETLEVWTVVRQAPGVTVPGMPPLKGFNDNPKAGLASVSVPLTKIRISCKDNEKLMGYTADGQADCRPVVEAKNPVASSDAIPAGALVCPEGEYMRGITKEGTPVCGQYPHVWQYNNTALCWEGAGVPAGLNCSSMVSFHECPAEPHAVMCTPTGNPFCWRKYGPYMYGSFPNAAGDQQVIPVLLQKESVGTGSFLTSCSGGGTSGSVSCFSSPNSAPDVKSAQGQVQMAKGFVLRIMRCVRPIRKNGADF